MGFLDKLHSRELKVAVLGLGYVGLPLCMAFHKAGLRVIGYDVSPSLTSQLLLGQSHVEAVTNEQLSAAIETGRFSVTDHWSVISDADAFIICVPTPLTRDRRPDNRFVENAVGVIKDAILHSRVNGADRDKERLVVLESTVAPGTTDRIVERSLAFAAKKLHCAFSPERENPGQSDFNAQNTPRIVGANTEEARKLAEALYSKITKVHLVDSTKIAEAAKVLENTYRLVNIALINELREMLDVLDIPIRDVIEAAATKPFGFQRFDPGPGIGGHCIPIDPFYLTNELAREGRYSKMIEAAGQVTQDTPRYVVRRIGELLNDKKGKALRGSRILAVGVTYKPDVSDTRESPAVEIMHGLMERGAAVGYYDPHVDILEFQGMYLTHQDSWGSLDWDAIVVLTAHSSVDHDQFLKADASTTILVDTRGHYRKSIDLCDDILEI